MGNSNDPTILRWLDARPEQVKPRIFDRLIRSDGCWEWSLSRNTEGYGQVWIPKTMVLVHRVVYLWEHRSIGEGMQIDHTCRNRRCANPDHLRELTPKANTRASSIWRPEHCPAGHQLDDDNLSPAHLRRGRRTCWTCQRLREQSRDRAIRAARVHLGLTHKDYVRRYGLGERTALALLES